MPAYELGSARTLANYAQWVAVTTQVCKASNSPPKIRMAVVALAAADWRCERREFVGFSFAYVWKRRISSKFSQTPLSHWTRYKVSSGFEAKRANTSKRYFQLW
jgi:hypothetical protein